MLDFFPHADKKDNFMSVAWKKFLWLFSTISLLFYSPFSWAKYQFASAEHITIGDNIKLFFFPGDQGTPGAYLHLPNGLSLTYGDIIAFGDLYGVSDKAISKGSTDNERRSLFLSAFNSFARDPNVILEASQLLKVMHDEKQNLEDAIRNDESSEAFYKRWGDTTSRQYNCITGGGCNSDWYLKPGRYLQLAENDFDHFGNNAWITYLTGHELAIETAIAAHQTRNNQLLELAYAMNAFACHFLTDRFASGHIRTPRNELPTHITPELVGSILGSYMHTEENAAGLHVHNLRGDHWIAYGDNSYYNPDNTQQRLLINETIQNSTLQIFQAYLTGSNKINDTVSPLIPQPDENGNQANVDISPLFYWDSDTQKLMRRKDISNVYDRHWTDDWWGWSTLIELERERGLPKESQAQLALSKLANQAIQQGVITDDQVLHDLPSLKKK